MRRYRISVRTLTATGALLVGLPMCASRSSDSKVTVTDTAVEPSQASQESSEIQAARVALAKSPLGTVSSRDARGKARFVTGATLAEAPLGKLTSIDAARLHLSRHASLLGLNQGVVGAALVVGEQPLRSGGSVVSFGQRINGVDVWGSRSNIVLDASKNLLAISGNLSSARTKLAVERAVTPESAVAIAYESKYKRALPAGIVRDGGTNGDIHQFDVQTTGDAVRLVDGAQVKPILYPVGDALVPAYYTQFIGREFDANKNEGFAFIIDAVDGRVLRTTSLTANETFKYRVWADTNAATFHVPYDGPLADYTPHPTGTPDGLKPGYVAPTLIEMEGFNHNPANAADPWLAATATETKGNNVDAYSDRNGASARNDAGVTPGDGFTPGVDYRADTTATRAFDRVYDTSKQPNASVDQIKAAVTDMFYVTNWMHDYWYDSGFNEAAGNAQADNLGRGGLAGDELRAEGQDGADLGTAGNANMSAGIDGSHPRMQMYVWNGVALATLTATATPALAFADGTGVADFGPKSFDVTGAAVLGTSATSTATAPNLGCNVAATDAGAAAPAPLNNVTGKIAVLTRGTCAFTEKAKNAQLGGAIGLVVINNATGHTFPGLGGADATLTIPTLGVTAEDGVNLRTAIGAGPVSLHMHRDLSVMLDGTIDNSIIAHEWGHYLHHRLVQCGSQSCGGMSEGWADFNALMMVIKEGDVLDNKTFALAQYAEYPAAQSAYYGIRRAPYTTDITKNPLTFGMISGSATLPPLGPNGGGDNFEVHNVGEVWAETLFEGYVGMLKDAQATPARYSFTQAKRRMADYVVAGMKATPAEPTFVEQRDALLATVYAADPLDFASLAKGFAKRGMGIGAVAPPVESEDLTEVVENFDYKGKLAYIGATLDDTVTSCDHDGVLDAKETGKLTVTVKNTGWVKLVAPKVTVSTTVAGVTVANGGAATFPDIPPYGTATATVNVSLDATVTARTRVPFALALAAPDAINAAVPETFEAAVAYDVTPAVSATDDVEAPTSIVWTTEQSVKPPASWNRVGDFTNSVWHGDDSGFPNDNKLVSPELTVSATDPFTIGFQHAYSFEVDPTTNWDGAVIEIQVKGSAATVDAGAGDGGAGDGGVVGDPWVDITTYTGTTDAGTALYTGKIYEGNPNQVLGGRQAFTGKSPNYPALQAVTLNLANKLAGKTVRVRFRIGTDDASGVEGWDIDNIAFSGITNKPFAKVVANSGICTAAPTDAGTDGATSEDDAGEGSTTGGTTGTSTKPPPVYSPVVTGDGDTNCGCRTAGAPTTRDGGMALMALGGLAVVIGRRRRRNDAA